MTTTARSRSLAGRRLAALSVAAMLGLTGCQALSPLETTRDYAPANGEMMRFEKADILDLMVLGTEPDGEGRVLGSIVNPGTEPVEVTLSAGDAELGTYEVAPQSTLKLADEEVTLPKTAAPGGLQEVTLQVGDTERTETVPVLLPTGEYEEYAPEGWTAPERETPEPAEHH